nr:hypothetical protein [Spirosomataceae bacterium]
MRELITRSLRGQFSTRNHVAVGLRAFFEVGVLGKVAVSQVIDNSDRLVAAKHNGPVEYRQYSIQRERVVGDIARV